MVPFCYISSSTHHLNMGIIVIVMLQMGTPILKVDCLRPLNELMAERLFICRKLSYPESDPLDHTVSPDVLLGSGVL